uniref:Uncharacterized protein n=1 Tax=Aegilops tauschii subsp. strangulata TaxID=200361 RepID=A0A453SN24_AEGTS
MMPWICSRVDSRCVHPEALLLIRPVLYVPETSVPARERHIAHVWGQRYHTDHRPRGIRHACSFDSE